MLIWHVTWTPVITKSFFPPMLSSVQNSSGLCLQGGVQAEEENGRFSQKQDSISNTKPQSQTHCWLAFPVDHFLSVKTKNKKFFTWLKGGSHRVSVSSEEKDPFRFRHMIPTDALQVRSMTNAGIVDYKL